jgi:hypothetical protein
MDRVKGSQAHLALWLRWTARIWSVASIALVLAFIIGERSLPSDLHQWVGFLLFPVGICVGMAVAWRHETLGGSLTVSSLIAFYVFNAATTGELPRGVAWLVFAAPGFIFIVTSLLGEKSAWIEP